MPAMEKQFDNFRKLQGIGALARAKIRRFGMQVQDASYRGSRA